MAEHEDEITQWLAKNGRKTLDVESAKQLAAESKEQWYVAAHGTRGYLVGKMTLQKYSARHIVVDGSGEALLFPNLEAALAFLRVDLRVPRPHVFTY